jgi:acyl carrier protein
MTISFEILKRILLGILDTHPGELRPKTDLLEEGILDSLQVLELATAIEERFKITLDPYDFTPQNFRSLQSLMALILQKQPRARKAM